MAELEQNQQNPMLALRKTILAKIEAWQAALSAIDYAVSMEGSGAPLPTAPGAVSGQAQASIGPPVELPVGAFLGKSLPAAVKLQLSAARRKQTIKEIATALKRGGVETNSSSFENVVTGALNRLKVSGEVLRFPDGWGLAEWYPDSYRSRIPAAANGKRPRKRRRAKKIEADSSQPAAGLKQLTSGNSESRLLAALRATEAPVKELAAKAAIDRVQTAHFLLGKLANTGKAVCGEVGYRLPS